MIALCSAMQALTSQQGVDLLTANQTLARRDCAQFYDFYAVCGIQTRLLSAGQCDQALFTRTKNNQYHGCE